MRSAPSVTGTPWLFLGWSMALMSGPMAAFAFLAARRRRLLADAALAPLRGIAIGVIIFAGYGLVLWAQDLRADRPG